LSESSRQFGLRALSPDHNREQFSSGVEPLDRYFRQQAGQDRRRDIAQVWVLEELESHLVAGFYTLSAAQIDLDNIPANLSRRLPRYPSVPALLLGRLAVDQRFRGQGLGRILLFDAFRRTCDISEQAGIFALLVDAKDVEAVTFYHRFGFEPTDDPNRLLIPLSRLRELMRAPR
jgi:GNAT superfamily N-acetyltransferase